MRCSIDDGGVDGDCGDALRPGHARCVSNSIACYAVCLDACSPAAPCLATTRVGCSSLVARRSFDAHFFACPCAEACASVSVGYISPFYREQNCIGQDSTCPRPKAPFQPALVDGARGSHCIAIAGPYHCPAPRFHQHTCMRRCTEYA